MIYDYVMQGLDLRRSSAQFPKAVRFTSTNACRWNFRPLGDFR